MNTLKIKFHGTICRFLEWLGRDESRAYQHHLKKFAKEVLKLEGSA